MLKRYHPDEKKPYLIFRYRVVRVWKQPLERFLAGGLGTLPLAVLTDEAKRDLVGVVAQIDERLKGLSNAAMAGRMQACTMLLLGLRYTEQQIADVRKGVEMVDLRESSFYKLIREECLTEGHLEEARETILSLGWEKIGVSPPDIEATLGGITDMARLKSIRGRLLKAASWDDLLAGA